MLTKEEKQKLKKFCSKMEKEKEEYNELKIKREVEFEQRIFPENKPLIEWIWNIREELFKQSELIRKLYEDIFGE